MAILPRIAAGDEAAVQECIDEYGGLVWSMARRLLGDDVEAEDAVQDAFVEIWRGADRFDPRLASERTYVAMLARRRIIDHLRSKRRRPDVPMPAESRLPSDADDRTLERGVEARLAARVFRKLPEERRRVLELAVYRGLTHREIAEASGMPVGTVKTHITRGLARVREILLSPEAASD